jgi:hypothetical protein
MANIYQCFDGQQGGFEPLANVAYRMEISQVSGDLDADVLDKAGVSTMLFLGFVEVNTDRTRDVVDDLRNKIDWAILDEDDGFVISDGGVDPEMVFYAFGLLLTWMTVVLRGTLLCFWSRLTWNRVCERG